jgi:hypothetical protein
LLLWQIRGQHEAMERFRMPEFIAPAPLLAVALLVANDRVFKPRFHNWVTGKLSDVAICFFLPLFTSALLGIFWPKRARARVLIGAGVAGLVFAAQETWPAFERVLLSALRVVGAPLGLRGFVLTSDITDLWALLMVPVAVAYGWHRVRAVSPQGSRTATSASQSRTGEGAKP